MFIYNLNSGQKTKHLDVGPKNTFSQKVDFTLYLSVPISQCRIRGVDADRQAQQDSYTEIHQLYPINRANSHNISNNEARKLDKCHI